MTNSGQIKITFLLLSLAFVVLVHSQETVQNKKNVSLHDLSVDETVKSALENGSVSEVVVRKDLLLFPVNAPNLVIAHTQEIHAVPQTNGTNTTDGKPTGAEVAEVNEYSLSQLVSTNDTDYDNETKSESSPGITASTLLRGPENVSVLEPGKLLEIVSGFNLSHGLATETLPLPDEVQHISIPKQSIAGLLSKSLEQSDALTTSTLPPYDLDDPQPDASITTSTATDSYSHGIAKRSADSEESNSSIEAMTAIPPYPYVVRKRSIDSDENGSDDDSASEDNSTEEAADTIDNGNDTDKRSIDSEKYDNDDNSTDVAENSAEYGKRSVNEDDSPVDNSSASTVESSSTMPNNGVKDNYKVETINNSTSDSRPFPINNGALNRIHTIKEKFRDDSPEDMEAAEDIVFRPLFRYRQETRLRQQASASRRSGYRKSSYNAYDNEYDDD